jgi:hypothetical protein
MSRTLAENDVLQLYENNDANPSIWVMGFSNRLIFLQKRENSRRLCNCPSDHQIILRSAPLAMYRWDFSGIKLSHGTVQEIPPIVENFHHIGEVVEE